jgi:hypothetical protein
MPPTTGGKTIGKVVRPRQREPEQQGQRGAGQRGNERELKRVQRALAGDHAGHAAPGRAGHQPDERKQEEQRGQGSQAGEQRVKRLLRSVHR